MERQKQHYRELLHRGGSSVLILSTPTKIYRRHCKNKSCRKLIKTVYIRQWTCGSAHCKAEYQRKKRIENKSEYRVGGRYYYYRRKVKKEEKITGAKKDIKKRLCLGVLCNGEIEFESDHKFNRVCDACKIAAGLRREM